MSVEMSGIVTLTYQKDLATAALAATDQTLEPVQGDGSVAELHAIQDGYIRGLDCEIEDAQSADDDVVFSVYVDGVREDSSELTVDGAGTSAGATYGTARFDRPGIPVRQGDSIVVQVKSTDATNTKPAGMLAVVYLQLGRSGI